MSFARTTILLSCAVVAFSCTTQEKPAKTTTSKAVTQNTTTQTTPSPQTMPTGMQNMPSTTETTAGTMSTRYVSATTRITGARCDREVTCNQVGSKKRFQTRDICTQEEGAKTQNELKSTDCPNGIDEQRLQTCLQAIAQQDCANLVTSLPMINECNKSALCASSGSSGQ